ncbi:hypothetical protein Tco_1427258, partial [Tanacetum coccineum]
MNPIATQLAALENALDFVALPSEEDLVTFIQVLGYSGICNMLSAIHIDQMHQPWRTFATIINRCIYGKTTGLDRLRESRAQILWTYYDFATGKVPPRKARKYKKAASLPRKLSPVKEAEHVKKAKRVKRPAKKSTSMPTAGVAIRDTPGASVSKKKAPAKADRSKGIEILSDVALSEAAQLKEATKRSKKDYHISQASGSGDGTDFESGVPDEQQRKTSDEGTSTKPGVPDVPTYDSESENESWGDSEDDNDDDSDDDSKGDDDKADSDDDGNSDADDNERTDSDDDDENPSFTLKDYDEEEHDEEYESDDDYENMFEEEDDDDLYKDVDVRSLETEHEKERQDDEEMTDADLNVSQELPYDQVVEDAHVTLTASQKTDDSKQSSSVYPNLIANFSSWKMFHQP